MLLFYFNNQSLGQKVELNQITYAAIGALIAGAIMLFSGSKQRTAEGEWSSALQWGYLLLMVGIFGVLSSGLAWSFTATLLLFTVLTGAIWLWQKWALKNWRTQSLQQNNQVFQDSNHFRDYIAGFFPVIAIVFLLRTFVVEPFQIPSSSMRPGLVKGDFILVSKFSYGLRVPVLNNVAIETGHIQRGDVVVFNYPLDTKTNYIKRIVAVGGDVIEYKDKILTVNGKASIDRYKDIYTYPDDTVADVSHKPQRFSSQLENKSFDILKEEDTPSVSLDFVGNYSELMQAKGEEAQLQIFRENCQFAPDNSGFTCKVPKGKYFAMGDNRDASADSRYWGFVDDHLIVGKAVLVWLNLRDMTRIGMVIK